MGSEDPAQGGPVILPLPDRYKDVETFFSRIPLSPGQADPHAHDLLSRGETAQSHLWWPPFQVVTFQVIENLIE